MIDPRGRDAFSAWHLRPGIGGNISKEEEEEEEPVRKGENIKP